MFDYQAIKSAHLIKLGLDDRGEIIDSDQMTLGELDQLKKQMGIE